MGRLLLITAFMCVVSPQAMTATNAVLTTTAELRALSEVEAKTGLRFDLTAQILQKHTGITGCSFIARYNQPRNDKLSNSHIPFSSFRYP